MATMDQVLQAELDARQQAGLYRRRSLLGSAQATQVMLDGRKVTAFCSNDYLGLANHPEVIRAFTAAAQDYGVGSGASHLIHGHSRWHQELEDALAEFTGRERALLFSTGFMANTGVLGALLDKADLVLEDKLNHASLLDGGLASGARFQRYLHNDLNNLETRLEKSAVGDFRRRLVVTDGVFSMDGDLAPLPQLADLAQRHNAWLMVDDAHGFGVLGERGAGCAEHFALSQARLPILMATLGKALGGFGAFVAGSAALIETLIQFARPYIYTTALPPAVAAANLKALALVQSEPWRREQLRHRISQLRSGVQALGLGLMPSPTPIQPVLLRDTQTTVRMAALLAEKGFMVGAIRPPTVAQGQSRLRITLSAEHTAAQVDSLINALGDCLAELPCGEGPGQAPKQCQR